MLLLSENTGEGNLRGAKEELCTWRLHQRRCTDTMPNHYHGSIPS